MRERDLVLVAFLEAVPVLFGCPLIVLFEGIVLGLDGHPKRMTVATLDGDDDRADECRGVWASG